MSDDLIKRLIILCSDTETELLALEAVARIKQLEAALRNVTEAFVSVVDYAEHFESVKAARAALEGKKDE
mgnify:CR=1 FL=1